MLLLVFVPILVRSFILFVVVVTGAALSRRPVPDGAGLITRVVSIPADVLRQINQALARRGDGAPASDGGWGFWMLFPRVVGETLFAAVFWVLVLACFDAFEFLPGLVWGTLGNAWGWIAARMGGG